ncbi:hypothetical protein AM2_0317 [Lactococcus cremoris]|nr:hypothetical protein N41_1329 [Lactococcus cremoris]KZK48463.1 hypothetical protein SK110_0688 [Lactococcus cremoris]KZK54953.1 hypothetical protein AM2_0317 [Lactococcus cremoris]
MSEILKNTAIFIFGHQHYSTQTNNLFQNKNARVDQIRA